MGKSISVIGVGPNFKLLLPYLYTSSVAGDGFGDIVSNGANTATHGNNYIFGGNLNFVSIGSSVKYDFSGRSASNAGDINGDGYNDLIIGVPYADKCYILFGGVTGFNNLNQGFTIFSDKSNDLTGWSVASAGDINKDGYSDIIIGAPNAKGGAGSAYIIYGKGNNFKDIYLDNLSIEDGFSINGPNIGSSCGMAVSGAGDINADGFDDMLVSCLNTNSLFSGAIYVIFGKASGYNNIDLTNFSNSQGYVINGPSWSWSGYSVSGAGDFNKDGYADIVIGTNPSKNNKFLQKSYIIYGKATGFVDISLAAFSNSIGFYIDNFGMNVLGVGDINGDGYDDLMIGRDYVFNGAGFLIDMPNKFTINPSLIPTIAPSSLPTYIPTLADTISHN